jgi:hypothetical protein
MTISNFKSTPLGIKLTSIAVRVMEVRPHTCAPTTHGYTLCYHHFMFVGTG